MEKKYRRHGFKHIFYADDLKLYASSCVAEISGLLHRIHLCVTEVNNWITFNKLVFNPEKTELLFCGSRIQLSKVPHDLLINISNIIIKSSMSVRDLGVHIDSTMSLKSHVNKVSQTAFTYLRVISRMRHLLNERSTTLLVHSLVLSRLIYCGSLYYGVNKSEIVQLNRIINYAVRVTKKLGTTDDVSQISSLLNWPDVTQRIIHHVCCIIHQVIYHRVPHTLSASIYLNNLSVNTRRGADQLLLKLPPTKTNSGRRAFKYCGPYLWNKLPLDIRQIKDKNTFSDKLLLFLINKKEDDM